MVVKEIVGDFLKKVSIIIPIYNAEQSIQNTIESCLRQTLDSIEIICINDGSTDGTENVLQQYRENERVVIICQENKGTGAARNTGIRRASSEYVFFLDSDDCFPDDDVLQTLYYEAKRNNVKICGGNAVIERHGKILKCEKNHPTYRHFVCPKTGLCDYLDTQFFVGFTRFIYQTDFIVENNIFFPEITEYEDPFFLVQAFYYARYYFVIDKNVYQIHRGDHIRTYNSDKKVKEALVGIGQVLRFSKEKQLRRLMSNVLVDIYNTRFNIFMYPFLENHIELISLEKDILELITQDLELDVEEKIIRGKFLEKSIKQEVDRTQKELEDFSRILTRERAVYIYGAGIIAGRVIDFVRQRDVEISACLVTSMEGNPKTFRGIEVKTVDCQTNIKNQLVIIALASTIEVNEMLLQLGYENRYSINFSRLRLVL